MKTLKAYKEAMAKIKSLAEDNEELAEALGVVETGVDAHVKALNAESKGHREGKADLHSRLEAIGTSLDLEDGYTAEDVTNFVDSLKAGANQNKSDSDARLSKLEKTIKTLTDERDTAQANAKKLKADNDAKTIKSAVTKELGKHNILEVHRDLLADRFAQKLTLDADGDVITSDGDTAGDLVKAFAEDPNNKGLIGTSQKGGGGGTPNEGGNVTENSYRGNLDAVVAGMKK